MMVPRIVRVVLPSLPLVVTFMGFIKAPDRPAGLKVIFIFAVFKAKIVKKCSNSNPNVPYVLNYADVPEKRKTGGA